MKNLLLGGFLLFTHAVMAQTHTDSLAASHDAQVYSATPTGNYGSGSGMQVKVATMSSHYRGFVNFDLASLSIPSNAIIIYAYMSLLPNGSEDASTNTTTYLQTATASWSESTITDANKPGTSTTNQVTTNMTLYSRRTFDVTTLIQQAIGSPSTFYGWQLRRNPETSTTSGNTYYTKEAAVTGASPRLKIQWYVPYSITAATINNASSTSASDGSITPTIANGSGSNAYEWKNASGTTVGTSSSLTGVGYGWYGLKVTGSQGDVFYMAFLVGVDCEVVSITFNPGPDYVDDAWLRSTASTTNYGTMQSINASNILSGTYYTAKNLVRFRLWMDVLQNPVQADLNLTGRNHYTAVRANTSDLLKVTSDWSENVVTYATMPTSNGSILKTIHATTSTNENKTVDIRDFWNNWKTDNTLNYGMLMQLQLYNGTAARMQFASSDTSNVASRPTISFTIDDGACDRTNYVKFKQVLDASFARTFQGKLKFYFTEEYQLDSGKKIPLTLYNPAYEVLAAIDQNGSAVSGNPLLPAVTYAFGDNRASLDLTGYSLVPGNVYILGLTRITGEKEYIKFIYVN